MLYLIIIFITMLADIGLALGLHYDGTTQTLLEAILGPLFALAYVLVMLGLFDLILRIFPRKMYDYQRKYYVASKSEMRFYERIGIRKWKNKVPELGASGGFSKRNLNSIEPEYLERFLFETCFGEILHLVTAVLGFTCLLFFPPSQYYFILPILVVNFILNILPCFIQRYNRHKLTALYTRITRNKAAEKKDSTEKENATE